MDTVKIKARAKINLSIDIKGVLEDGYHDVEMVMQSIDLSDYLTIKKTDREFSIKNSNMDSPSAKKNIIYKTWQLMKEKFDLDGQIEVDLEKNIPIAAGLAGGSADSAGILVGVNHLYDLGLEEESLIELSKELGSDIAFCIKGGACLATGKGTDLVKVATLDKKIHILVCKPNIFVSTKKVYNKFDHIYQDVFGISGASFGNDSDDDIVKIYEDTRPNNRKLIDALIQDNRRKLVSSMKNVLEPVTMSWYSNIDKIKKIMINDGAFFSMMSGSGPTVFGFFDDYGKARRCKNYLKRRYSQTYITFASEKGVEICGY